MDPAFAAPQGPNNFPQELVDEIVGYLRDSPKDLLACSQVCMSWSFAASRHRFGKLFVLKRHIRDVLAVLDSSERIRNNVKCLVLGVDHSKLLRYPEASKLSHREMELQFPCSLEEILIIMARLPKLEEVFMIGIVPKYVPMHRSLDHIRGMHFNLKKLTLVDTWNFLYDHSSFHLFFSAFDQIEKLVVRLTREYSVPPGGLRFAAKDLALPLPVTISSVFVDCGRALCLDLASVLLDAICEPEEVVYLRLKVHEKEHAMVLPVYHHLISRFKCLEELQMSLPFLDWCMRQCSRLLPGTCPSHMLHAWINIGNIWTEFVERPLLLPDLSSHQRLRIVHVDELHYREDTYEWDYYAEVMRMEDYFWEELNFMLYSAAALRGIFLHFGDDNMVYVPEFDECMVRNSMKNEPRDEGGLGDLHEFNWGLFTETFRKYPEFTNAFVLLSASEDRPLKKRWSSYPKTVDAIRAQMPQDISAKLAFGVASDEHITYMWVNPIFSHGLV